MSTPACPHPIAVDTLVEYWLGALDDERVQRVDEHLLGSHHCGAQLDELVALMEGLRLAFDAGRAWWSAPDSRRVVGRARTEGARVPGGAQRQCQLQRRAGR